MSVWDAVWSYGQAWFGYVGWCLSSTDMACKPFLAFVAMTAAAGGALVLLCRCLQGLVNDVALDLRQRRAMRRMACATALVRKGGPFASMKKWVYGARMQSRMGAAIAESQPVSEESAARS
jgi:hypothetical protein